MCCVWEKLNKIIQDIQHLRRDVENMRKLMVREHQENRDLIRQIREILNGQQQPQQP